MLCHFDKVQFSEVARSSCTGFVVFLLWIYLELRVKVVVGQSLSVQGLEGIPVSQKLLYIGQDGGAETTSRVALLCVHWKVLTGEKPLGPLHVPSLRDAGCRVSETFKN